MFTKIRNYFTVKKWKKICKIKDFKTKIIEINKIYYVLIGKYDDSDELVFLYELKDIKKWLKMFGYQMMFKDNPYCHFIYEVRQVVGPTDIIEIINKLHRTNLFIHPVVNKIYSRFL